MLRLIRQESPPPEISILIESPVPGVVLIDIVLDSHNAPLHWRAGSWDKPPLDVSLRPDGWLAGVQFVVQDEEVPMRAGLDPSSGEAGGGWPIFEVALWPDDERYVDEKLHVSFERVAASLVLRIGFEPAQRWARVGAGMAVGLNAADDVVGMVFGPLHADDWDVIETFSSVS